MRFYGILNSHADIQNNPTIVSLKLTEFCNQEIGIVYRLSEILDTILPYILFIFSADSGNTVVPTFAV